MSYCPCGSGRKYLDCCDVFITGQESPSTPELLMRSRYSAYSKVKTEYIMKTMKSPAADNFSAENAKAWAKKNKWTRLQIIKATNDEHDPNKGFVEFIAQYQSGNKTYMLHEISEFHFVEGKWYYVDGQYLK